MCGIAGVIKQSGPVTSADVAAVVRMMDAQVHRGPDDWGILVPDEAMRDVAIRGSLEALGLDHVCTYPTSSIATRAVLGSRRLSVVDLSSRARMPMGTTDRRVWITYNGEVYNSRELRVELTRRGYAFFSDSDTETVLHGYEEWGEEVVDRLRGMFAFAILDTSDDPRLILARDRLGIKPLYYYEDGTAIVFASEVRAIARSGLVPIERNVGALVRFLQLGSVPQPLTTLRGVLALRQAHVLSVGPGGRRLRQYWDLSTHLYGASSVVARPDELVSETRTLLEESVRLHLLSDAPLGIFLSGGIDSSALVALARRFLAKPPTTVSLAFEEPAFNEAPYARLVAKRYGTDHREFVVRRGDLVDELPRIFAAMDQPTVDGVNSYFVSKAARSAGLTVVLSGTGGDEVFLGYQHFRQAHALEPLWRLLGRLPTPMRKRVVRLAAGMGRLSRKNGLDRLAYLNTSPSNVYLLFRGLFTPRQIQDLLRVGERELDEAIDSLSPFSPIRSLLDSIVLGEFRHYLPNQLLKDMDFMSMAYSVETRVPYLDHVLVEHAARLPMAAKLHNRINKGLLVSALGQDLPPEVWDRPKMGFTLPFEPWLKQQADCLRALSSEQKLLDRSAVERVWDRARKGRTHWSRAWALAVLGGFEPTRAASAA